jgi:hypothetical protein
MRQDDICGAILDPAPTPAPFRRLKALPSVEVREVRERLEGIVGLFHDLDAALDGLGYRGDRAACQLSHRVKAQMIDRWLFDIADHPPGRIRRQRRLQITDSINTTSPHDVRHSACSTEPASTLGAASQRVTLARP